jgi:hypothetical protein
MKANELRIGSYYQSVKFNQPVKIDISDFRELYILCDYAELDEDIIAEMFKPIPLTEAWLIDFGLILKRIPDEVDDKKYYDDVYLFNKEYEEFGLCRYNDNYYFDLVFNDDSGWGTIGVVEIKYVHQFQNLYWCICGKELEK